VSGAQVPLSNDGHNPFREVVPFEIGGPLPSGVTLLEASAGTGKTFTIASLVVRYVASGLRLEELLVVTFTRMATGELRDRVRKSLVSAAHGLTQVIDGAKVDDEIVRLLADTSDAERKLRRDRLVAANADFDAATIDTTHGFCLHVLMGLGVAGDVERDVKLVEDTSDLLEDVVDDLYVRKFWQIPGKAVFDLKVAREVGASIVEHSSAYVLPALSDGQTAAELRRRLADAVLKEMSRRKRSLGILTYDDLQSRLREALTDADRGDAARRRLSDRYKIVLVDEFQDTDPVQWNILESAFGGSNLVLIGDPKQAIYAFRGADVYAYLRAADRADNLKTLNVNWRSDQGLIDAYDVLFAGAQLGHSGILYHPVRASDDNQAPGLRGAPRSDPLRVRILESSRVAQNQDKTVKVGEARPFIARDLASDVRELLSSGAEIVEHRDRGGNDRWAPVTPGDIAVLVRANSHAVIVRNALHDVGIPAVLAGGGSVFSTPPAKDWMRLLVAIEKPTSRELAATAAITPFVGWDAEMIAKADQDVWEELHQRLARWSSVLRDRGVAALGERITGSGLPQRVLSRPSGERTLTDLSHVGRLLHEAAIEGNLGPAALITWLSKRIKEADSDKMDDERSIRLDSDADAVQILTIHRSKGLEFPIVYCPFLWDANTKKQNVPVFHDPESEDRLTIDVGGGNNRTFVEHQNRKLAEEKGEHLRLLYVALTQARHQAVIWWASSNSTRESPLGRLVFRDPEGNVLEKTEKYSEGDVRKRFLALSAKSGGAIAVEDADGGTVQHWVTDSAERQVLESAVFDRTFDDLWKRTSYSGITQGAHDAAMVGSEPDEVLVEDEPTESEVLAADQVETEDDKPELTSISLLLGGMPGGTAVGTFVHSVFEETDFAASDLDSELERAVGSVMSHRPVDIGDCHNFISGLKTAIDTPLGDLVDGTRLRDIDKSNRLDEVGFELPLAGGDNPCGNISVLDIASLLRQHLGDDDELSRYAERLKDPTLSRELRGFLTGSIDLVLRFSGKRLAIVDYKTNRLAPSSEELTAWNFNQRAMSAEMQRAHYPLQAILYTVAFHRYMRWRDPGYEVERDFAGVIYLFVRGMSSTAFPISDGKPCGVWSWRPPAALITELSDLFDSGRPVA
jgi:exodeoxyribonuclease V beta subunit